MEWPNSAPPELAKELDQIARYRVAPATSDIWAVLKEWLERNEVKPPEKPAQPNREPEAQGL
jgi:hypothetical protein